MHVLGMLYIRNRQKGLLDEVCVRICVGVVFFFKRKSACEVRLSLVGSEMCIGVR